MSDRWRCSLQKLTVIVSKVLGKTRASGSLSSVCHRSRANVCPFGQSQAGAWGQTPPPRPQPAVSPPKGELILVALSQQGISIIFPFALFIPSATLPPLQFYTMIAGTGLSEVPRSSLWPCGHITPAVSSLDALTTALRTSEPKNDNVPPLCFLLS